MQPKTRLIGTKRLNPSEEFMALSHFARMNEQNTLDFYGVGEQLNSFEIKLAEDLGFAAAVFMPSGTMAQQIAMKIHSEDSKRPIAFHPLSHLQIYEEHGYEELHHMESLLLGSPQSCLVLSDIKNKDISALLYELPQRDLGGVLPTFDELIKMSEYCKENSIFFHLDGARIWECAPFYNKSVQEICSLFDSVYVSFYKGLNAIAGAMLLGNDSFIAKAKVWQRRHGGNLIHLYPYSLSAEKAYTENLNKMSRYFDVAHLTAQIFNRSKLLRTNPLKPQSNMFHLMFKEDIEIVQEKIVSIENEFNTILFSRPRKILYLDNDYICFCELSMGDNSIAYDLKQLEEIIKKYF